MARGGKRDGAGRKAMHPDGRLVTIAARVAPDVIQWIREQASVQGVSMGRIIEECVRSFDKLAQE